MVLNLATCPDDQIEASGYTSAKDFRQSTASAIRQIEELRGEEIPGRACLELRTYRDRT
jgi:hypothetical protein